MGVLQTNKILQTLAITLGTTVTAVGVYFFMFPNNFCFGGVSGIAVVVSSLTSLSAGSVSFIVNIALLLVGFIFLGKGFGAKTVYVVLVFSFVISGLEFLYPLSKPLTNEPVLECFLAILIPAVGSALLFNLGASGGGTDILAMILKKYSGINVGLSLLFVDFFIAAAAFFVFDIQAGLFSFVGLLSKTFVINGTIESFNLSKYFNIICEKPDVICEYINTTLKRGATVSNATGAFTKQDKYIIFTALRRSQAIQLRNFVRTVEPNAFIMITNSSEIIGNGFQQ